MSDLRLTLLGRPQVVSDGTLLTGWALQKSLALLAYLAVTGRPHSRGALAGLLWRDCTEANARSNLRKVLAELRQRVPSHLTVTRAEVAFDRASAYWLDVEAFEQSIGRALVLGASPVTPARAAVLTEALDLWCGELLAGLELHRAPAFEEWLLLERAHLRNLALRALHALVDHHAARAQPEQALAYLDRLLALEPADEEAHRHKMLLLARGGQRSAALRQYEACRQAMQALDVELDGETAALYQRIRAGAESPASRAVRPLGPGLHVPLTPLVGREAELAEIQEYLHDPSCRLLTLTGPGGVGKTHLALRVVEEMLSPDGFEDGVYLVPVGSLLAVEAIAPAIAQALDLSLAEGAHTQQHIANHLYGKQVLLVMDGFEHLLTAAGLLVDLLHTIPGLKILVTSRARLDVEGETVLTIQGLACPSCLPGRCEALASSPAVQLFVSGARRTQPGLALTDAELLDVAHLCHLVGGLPLAILLAAGWAGMLTPAAIAAEIEGELGRGLDLLQTDGHNLPFPQRSMRAVLDRSWGLLADRERQALAGLSLFRDSFTLEAAHQVTSATLRELRVLMDWSLLQRAAGGRYTIHELLRQYAGEKLAGAPDAAQSARDRHSAYFAAAVAWWWIDLQGPRHRLALAEMVAESGNLRVAWDWSAARGQVAQLDRAMDGLCYFHKWLGRYEEGESLCRLAVEGLAEAGVRRHEEPPDPSGVSLAEDPVERKRVLARALAWQGVFCRRLGRREQAGELLQHSLDLLDDLAWTEPDEASGPPKEIQRGRAFVLWRLGNLASDLDREDAQRLYRQSLALYRELKDSWGTSNVLEALGRSATFSGEGDMARHALEESLELRQAQGDDQGSNRVLLLDLAAAAYEGQDGREPGESAVILAPALHEVGLAIGAGQFARAETLLARWLSTKEAPGAGHSGDLVELVRAFNQMHLGHYEEARSQAMTCLARFREADYRWGIERCCYYLAFAALTTGAYDEAQRWLQESVGLCRDLRQWGHLGQALALMALVARASGNLSQARQHLRGALRVARHVHDYETFMFQLIVVLAMALLLADEGQDERALELYATALRYPLIANSRLVKDLAGRQMAAIAIRLPADIAATAHARGHARGLEAAVGELLAERGV